jgi:HPt (histidine-containing phosphotransfer) domain-containing protein
MPARVDWPRLASLGDGSPGGGDRVRRLIDLFLSTGRESLEAIRRAHREDSRDDLERALHKLKGACGTLGATVLFRLVGSLESQFRNPDPGTEPGLGNEFPARLEELEREFDLTEAALRSPA